MIRLKRTEEIKNGITEVVIKNTCDICEIEYPFRAGAIMPLDGKATSMCPECYEIYRQGDY